MQVCYHTCMGDKIQERLARTAARKVLYEAVKRGDIVKPRICEACAYDSHRICAWHADVTKPLKVTWLCALCVGIIKSAGSLHATRRHMRAISALYRPTPG